VNPIRSVRVRLLALALLGGLSIACDSGPVGVAPEGAVDLAAPWLQVAPETVGLNENSLFLAGEIGSRIERMRSLVVVRKGRLAYERYYGGSTVDTLADVRSVTKSVVATLVGIAIANGAIAGLDQPITDFLDSSDFDVRPEHELVTIRHLLTMTSGFYWSEDNVTGYHDWIESDDQVNYLLSRPFVATPGTTFTYNSAAAHLLGVVLEKAVRRPLPDFADDVLFGPLGIRQREWEDLSDGYVNGAAGLDLRPRDLARLGQLYLQEGWSGTRAVVPPLWVEEATTPRWNSLGPVGPIENVSYGFLWWLDQDRGAYFAWGFAGQFIYVVPRLDLVVVATTEWRGVSQDVGYRALQEEVLGLIVNSVLPAAR
jgi:CubicO group peptidase (beta-lactamase class C family)